MRTEDLIAVLGRDAAPVAPRAVQKRLALAGLAGLAAALVLVLLAYGARDLAAAVAATALKGALMLAIIAVAALFALAASRPALRVGRAATPLVVVLGLSLLAAAVATALAPAGARAEALFQGGIPPCLYEIPIAAIPAAVIVFLAVRSLGPTQLALAGAAAGALSGGVAALAYALHCQMDSAAYVLAWYPIAAAITAVLGAVVGTRALRW
jgi:hypothetical protein